MRGKNKHMYTLYKFHGFIRKKIFYLKKNLQIKQFAVTMK